MTRSEAESTRAAELLDALLMSDADDERIGADLVPLENSTDKAIQTACHQARHFIADRDVHARDPAYARQQRSLIAEIVCRLRGKVIG